MKINVVNNSDDKDMSGVLVAEFIISFKLGRGSLAAPLSWWDDKAWSLCVVLSSMLSIVAFFMRAVELSLPTVFYLIFTSFKQRTLNPQGSLIIHRLCMLQIISEKVFEVVLLIVIRLLSVLTQLVQYYSRLY